MSSLPPPLLVSLRTAASLLVFAVVGTALLAATFDLTKDNIAKNEEKAKLALIGQILPSDAYDNTLLQDAVQIAPSPDLGTSDATTAFRARKDGKPVAVVLEAVAPDGYAGKIKLIVSIYANGELGGVRVVSHNETPGLGDYIEIGRSKWIEVFGGKSLANPDEKGWHVKKDGGVFAHTSGATVTPRAVVKAVYKALLYYRRNQDALFANPPAAAGQGAPS